MPSLGLWPGSGTVPVDSGRMRTAALLVSFLLLTDCGGCERAGAGAPPSATDARVSPSTGESSQPGMSGLDASGMLGGLESVEFGPADLGVRQHAGEMDVKNDYASTVMLSLRNPREMPDCSGVLLAPQRVLTAASCVCALRGETPASQGGEVRADASSCAKRVFVTAVVYGEVGSPRLKELSTQMVFHTVEGSIRPHPEMELVLDKRGFVLRGRADLAMVLLDKPLMIEGGEVLPSHEEVHGGESLVMAGYGHDEQVGGFYGARYFRTNRVTSIRPSSEGSQIVYAQQGTYAYNGFDGGPCFREDGKRRWLVGIASARADQELMCTSTTLYRDWIVEQLKHVPGEQEVQ
jgi:trypsin-like peptidase